MRNFFIALTRTPIGLVGTAITTASALAMVTLFVLGLWFGLGEHPYIGILTYMILPAIFVVGLLLIPLGIVRERRRLRAAAGRGEPPPAFPVFDLNRGATRKRFLFFLLFTAVNLVILATATYKGVEVMDSTAFCGTTCHSVMHPEHTAHQRSPHAEVACVSCHIGPGAGSFVRSKLSGAWQVVSVAFDLYPRPIPAPVHDMRPARETCGNCHQGSRFVGDKLEVRTSHADDETSTELKTVLLLKVGGRSSRGASGIHWHADPDTQIRYRADPSRQTIYDVELRDADGSVRSYSAADRPPEAAGEWRVMDCVDCHNRPTHVFRSPVREVDDALREERLPRSLPYLRREAVRVLQKKYPSHAEAREGIAVELAAFYREQYPELAASSGDRIAEAGRVLGDIYCLNVFPLMNVGWNTYPDHRGHQDSPGCFRCHDDAHATAEGRTISQDCSICHTVLAMEEPDPEVLRQLQP